MTIKRTIQNWMNNWSNELFSERKIKMKVSITLMSVAKIYYEYLLVSLFCFNNSFLKFHKTHEKLRLMTQKSSCETHGKTRENKNQIYSTVQLMNLNHKPPLSTL